MCVDETTDARGLSITSLRIGTLKPESLPDTFLIAYQHLNSTNYEKINRFINENLRKFFENILFGNRILLFITDAATYMVKAAKGLKLFYKNLHHVTCVVYGLNRLAEKVRELCPRIKELVSCGKKMFLKAPNRVEIYRRFMLDKP